MVVKVMVGVLLLLMQAHICLVVGVKVMVVLVLNSHRRTDGRAGARHVRLLVGG